MNVPVALRGVFDRDGAVRSVGWTVVGLAVVVTAVVAVGPGRIIGAVARADRATVAAVAGLLFAALLVRGLVLWTTLRAVGAPVGVGRALVTYFAVSFVNTVVPGGGAGGTPVAGLVIARSARTDYEVGVAATLAVTTLTNLMVGVFGVLGVLLLATTGGPEGAVSAGAVGVGLFVAGTVAAAVLWRVRDRAGDAVVDGVIGLLESLDRRLPWSMPDRATVEAHARTAGEAAERIVGGSPAQSAALLGLSALAHLLSVTALLFALGALDVHVPVGVLLAVIPTAVLAAVAPAPGAGGGVEVALGVLLAAVTGAPVAAVGAAVVIYRASGYAFRLGIGGLAAAALFALR